MTAIPLLPPAFAATPEAMNWLATNERLAIDELLAGTITETNLDIVRSMAKVAVRTAQRARKAPHTRGILERDALDEAERICLAMLATVKLMETGGVTENNKVVLRIFDQWYGVMNKEIPRAVWLAAMRPPKKGKK